MPARWSVAGSITASPLFVSTARAVREPPPVRAWLSNVGHRGDDLLADNFEWRDPVYVRHETYDGLYAHTREPAQLTDQLVHPLAVLADIEGESAGLLYRAIVPVLILAVPA